MARPAGITFLGTSSVFDCAEGTQLKLQESKLKMGRITRVFITHMHADHVMGLVTLLGTLMMGVATGADELERLRVLGRGKKVRRAPSDVRRASAEGAREEGGARCEAREDTSSEARKPPRAA
ncbi:hypothetical protein QFC19_006636 [Naganishia cerealis]|uniref:Uncharacterized protein n=1 Tax=Naganishia cerealis TaxID=610337 RepID=A0ACC2VG70_9TREE|nr:hypothetical protein QFC19_006636 [Naganishia cerealis]